MSKHGEENADVKIYATKDTKKNYNIRVLSSDDGSYNAIFNTTNGYFCRWGISIEDNPQYSPIGPEIIDMELSTICHGINGKLCGFCYKSNSGSGRNMSFDTFREIFHRLPNSVLQIAFGIGDIDANPDLWKILQYCRTNGERIVVPNITINGYGLTDDYADRLAAVTGSVAVSHYDDDDICFDAVKKLTDRIGKNGNTLMQVNIHQLVCEETYDKCFSLLSSAKRDPRLKKLSAVVFLSLKRKGRGSRYTVLADDKFFDLVREAITSGIGIGFDSCGTHKFLMSLDPSSRSELLPYIESCDAALFSGYINVDGNFYPCSFVENEPELGNGISILGTNDFVTDVWNNEKIRKFRDRVILSEIESPIKCKSCPIHQV